MTQRLSRHFGTLIGRRVAFAAVRPTPESKAQQMWGVYTVSPDNAPMVVQADLPLLGSFAGALVGLPAQEVTGRLRGRPLDELLRDAIYEVLNIAGAVIMNEHHIALSAMTEEKKELQEGAAGLLAAAAIRSDFDVTIDGYPGGRLTVFS
ncbi:MAG: hypothetical protein ACLGXA_20150 [Acidobacteriota bacterium]